MKKRSPRNKNDGEEKTINYSEFSLFGKLVHRIRLILRDHLSEDIGHDPAVEIVLHFDGGVDRRAELGLLPVREDECDFLMRGELIESLEGECLISSNAESFPPFSFFE